DPQQDADADLALGERSRLVACVVAELGRAAVRELQRATREALQQQRAVDRGVDRGVRRARAAGKHGEEQSGEELHDSRRLIRARAGAKPRRAQSAGRSRTWIPPPVRPLTVTVMWPAPSALCV